jgi:RHS repeat-associated protein
MRQSLALALLSFFCACVTCLAHAQCTSPTLTSFSITPNVISGDQSQFATGTIQACLPSGNQNLSVAISATQVSATQTICNGGVVEEGGCNYYGVGSGNVTVSFQINAYNYSGQTGTGTITVSLYSPNTEGSAQLTVTSAGSPYEPPSQDPDGPCPDCGNANAGNPINVTNGDTWIPQQDYSIPGLGGGLKLTRTWNSLWANMNPPEESGIFGDSWRSNFEEYIQLISGGARYWKGNGSSLFYSYDSGSSAYYLTAPANDQTTLTTNSLTGGWIIAQKDGTQRFFNSGGYLTSIADRNGNTIIINMDVTNPSRIDSITDAANRTLTFNYSNPNSPTLCTSITDSVGTVATYVYDSLGRLTQVQYPDSSQYNFQYNDPNSNTLISLIADSQGSTVEAHSYDSLRRGVTSQQANDANGNPVNKVTIYYGSPRAWENYVCDSTSENCVPVQVSNRAQRHFLSLTAGENGANACNTCGFPGVSAATFDLSGYQTSSTDGNGHTTVYTYDTYGNIASRALPDMYTGSYDTWNYTYNSFGEVLTVTDPLGAAAGDPNHTTVNNYDSNGNLLSTTTPSPNGGGTPGSTTSFTYNSNGTVNTITDPLGNVSTITYYPTGLIYTVTDAAGNVTTYAYDPRGNRTSVIDAMSHQTQFQYDSMNRLTKITYADNSTVQFAYDWRGRRTSVTDQNGRVTQYAYDDANRMTSVTDAQTPTAGVTTYGYDTENDLTDVWDAAGNHTQFVFFPGKYLYETVFPSGQRESYAWDDNNNLEDKTDRNGNTINYYYDYQNHVYYKQDPGTIFYYYDPAGRLTEVDDYNSNNGFYYFSYDNINRLISTTTNYAYTSLSPFTVQYGYDAASNRVSMTDPQGTVTTYGYDQLNRLASLSNSWAGSFGFSYDALSRRTQLARPNGINTNYSYDNLSHLLSVLHQSGSVTLDGENYTYDPAGNRLSKTDLYANVTSNYTYDAIYQLTQVTQGTSTTESYTYDIVGNRLSSLGVSPYQYNTSNELTSTPSGSYSYDHNGNMLNRPDGTQFSWDYENRLSQAVLPSNGGTVTFKYDPFGRRIQKTSPTATSIFVYDGPNLIETVNASGAKVASYTRTRTIDETLAELRRSTTDYYEADGLESVTSLSTSAAAIANTYTYDSFGNVTNLTGTLRNPFQYTGREFDSETGIYYYRARYYDENIGRFVSADPIGFRGGINFYRYARNNPPRYRDPLGLWAAGVGVGVAGGIGGPRYAGFGEASCNLVFDSSGHIGLLCCKGGGAGVIAPLGAFGGVQGGGMFCPSCTSICDMQGAYVTTFGTADAGEGASGGGGASLSSSSVTFTAAYGPSAGEGAGGGVIVGGCQLVVGGGFCKNCPNKGSSQ